MNTPPTIQRLAVDPTPARVASMLSALLGQPRAVVTHFVLDVDGQQLKATPAELDAVLADFRGHSTEQPEAYLARLTAKLRSCFK